MSNPSRSQQRFPFRAPVQVRRNYRKLPPITQTIQPIEQENEPTKSSLSIGSVDIEYETPPPPPVEAPDFWVRFRENITKERLKHYDNHGNQQTPNKVVRIFVSSTFTDFFNEREVLIKKVMKIFTININYSFFSWNERYFLHYVMKWNQRVFK
jgi:hypothetical protein